MDDFPEPPVPESLLVGVECRVCQTRMYGRLDQVGKRMKCPDCGAETVLPPPPKPEPKRQPAAMEGEQYELWGPDEQPLPADLIKAQPHYVTVACRLCGTLLQATVDQVGKVLVCPDCTTKNVVPPPPAPKRVRPANDEGYEIDASRDPGERPPVVFVRGAGLLYEQEEADERAKVAAIVAKRKRNITASSEPRGRPKMPRWPLVTGVVPFLFERGTRLRWYGLSLAGMASVGLLVDAISKWYLWQPQNRVLAQFAVAAGGLAEMLIAVVLTIMWAAAASSIFVAIVSESSDGNVRVHNWPGVNFIESLTELLFVALAVAFSMAPGWIAGHVAGAEMPLLWALGGAVLCFPIVFLSQLAADSPWALVSGRVVAGFVGHPISSLVFYLESAMLAAVCAVAVVQSAPQHYLLPVLFAPLLVAAGLLNGRILGRLAWVFAAREKEKTGDA